MALVSLLILLETVLTSRKVKKPKSGTSTGISKSRRRKHHQANQRSLVSNLLNFLFKSLKEKLARTYTQTQRERLTFPSNTAALKQKGMTFKERLGMHERKSSSALSKISGGSPKSKVTTPKQHSSV